MNFLKKLRKYSHDVVEWVDSIPSIPATCGGIVIGFLASKTILFVLIIVILLWAAEKLYNN